MMSRSLVMAVLVVALLVACSYSAPTATVAPRMTVESTNTPTFTATRETANTGDVQATDAASTVIAAALAANTPTPVTLLLEAEVIEVVDGGTIKVMLDGAVYTVRYLGIAVPESKPPSKHEEWMAPEARTANQALVEDKTVLLEPGMSDTDAYGRLLRYVYVGDVFVNLELVRLGYATLSTVPPAAKYAELFMAAQEEARATGRGLWSATPTARSSPAPIAPTATPTVPPTLAIPTQTPSVTPAPTLPPPPTQTPRTPPGTPTPGASPMPPPSFTPAPTQPPSQPTATLLPTHTPRVPPVEPPPSATPAPTQPPSQPTATPLPTPTPRVPQVEPPPSATPAPTQPSSQPTATPLPTHTPRAPP